MRRYEHHTDHDLVQMLIAGDELAFEEIYHRYAASLNAFAINKTSSREDASEIVQEIFVWLWQNRARLHNITHLRSYLFGAAKNRILNYYRSDKVRHRYAADFSAFQEKYTSSTEDQVQFAELTEVIRTGLAGLPEKCQTAFRLSRIENMPISGIAQEMAISRRTVENYISRALKHLRKKVDGLG